MKSHLVWCSPVLLCLLTAACGRKAGPVVPPAAAPAAAGTVLTTKGGTIELDRAKLEVPEGALAGDRRAVIRVRADAPALASPAQVRVSPAVSVNLGQVGFSKPVRLTLPVDAAALGSSTEAHALLCAGAAFERLPVAVKLDRAAGTASFELDRTLPLANLLGGSASGEDSTVTVAVDREGFGTLDASPDLVIHAPPSLDAAARALVGDLKARLAEARAGYQANKFPLPAKIDLYIGHLAPYAQAQASGGNTLDINIDLWPASPDGYKTHAMTHEVFHLVQQKFKLANIRNAGMTIDPGELSPTVARWMDEGTAEFMAARAHPENIPYLLPKLKLDFGYRSLVVYDQAQNDPHEYQTYIFFAYLDSLYDGPGIIRACYVHSMGGTAADREARRGAWEPLDILNAVLRSTPDKRGRVRPLKEVYAEFLMHLYWLKDFHPLSDGGVTELVTRELGRRGEIKLPTRSDPPKDGDAHVAWNLPDEEGGKRVLTKSGSLYGEGYSIARAFNISSMTKKSEKGDLSIRLSAGAGADAESAMLLAFAVRKGPREPLFGNSRTPILIPKWEECGSALVFVIDVSGRGFGEWKLTAEMKAPKEEPPKWVMELALDTNMRNRVTDGGTYTIEGTQAEVYGDCGLTSASGKLAGLLKVSRPGSAPRYMTRGPFEIARHAPYPLIAGSQELRVEALDEQGTVVLSQKFTMVCEYKPGPSRIALCQDIIDNEKKKAKPDRSMIVSQLLWIAREHDSNLDYDRAWASLLELEKEYGDVIATEKQASFFFPVRHSFALHRNDLGEAVASMERWAAALPQMKYECFRTLAKDYILLAHDAKKAHAAWNQYREEVKRKGQMAADWPYPDIRDPK